MVVGRRRVAAASVATACALHVYVLPNTIFDRPVPAIPPLSSLIPIAQKFVCTRVADTSRGCWYCVRSFLSIFATLLFHPSADSLPLSQFSISRPLHPPSGYTYTFRILSLRAEKRREAPGSAGKRWETPGSAGKRRAAPRRATLPPLL